MKMIDENTVKIMKNHESDIETVKNVKNIEHNEHDRTMIETI